MPEQYYHSDPLALHTSRRDTLNRCPRKYFIEYILGLERIDEDKKGLRMGDAFAQSLEKWDPAAVSIPYMPLIEAATDEYTAKALLEESQVVKVYAKKYMEIYPQSPEREVIWDLPIPGTTYRNCGTIDFIEQNDVLQYLGGEDKFLAQWGDDKERAIDMDDQVTGEILGMVGNGYKPVVGLRYRVTKKSGIAQRTKRNPETFPEFLERLEQKLVDDQSEHFMEFHTTRTIAELHEFNDELLETAEYIDWMLQRVEDGKPSFRRTPKTCGYRGGCEHIEMCMRHPNAEVLYRHKVTKEPVQLTEEQLTILNEGV